MRTGIQYIYIGGAGDGGDEEGDDGGWIDVDDNDATFQEPDQCTSQKALNVPQQDDLSVMDAFTLIFDMDFLRMIKAETNRYARQCQNERQRTNWSIVTIDEVKRFFAITIHMSLVKKPALRDYFSTDPVLYASFPSQIGMSRDRFLSILRYIHVNDNSTYIPRDQPNHDPLHKVRPMVDLLNQKFRELYTPSENLTLDEAMIPFRGRVSFKVYMKNKPNKYGVRLEVVTDADNGVVLHFETYTGNAGQQSNTVKDLVLRMLAPFEGKNFKVFMDRRYSSPELFEELRRKGFYPTGTVMKSRRGLPKSFGRKLKPGEILNRRKGDLMAIKWRDKRDVFILSTSDKAEMIVTGENRNPRAGGNHQTSKPAAVVRYNKNKAGVDRADQMASYYPMYRKTVKWWKKVFFGLFTMALINICKYRNMKNGRTTKLSTFLTELAKDLAECTNDEERVALPPAAAEPRRHQPGMHFPVRHPPTAAKQNPTRVCVLCSKKRTANGKAVRRESSWKCKTCGVCLCVECFLPYHHPRHGERDK